MFATATATRAAEIFNQTGWNALDDHTETATLADHYGRRGQNSLVLKPLAEAKRESVAILSEVGHWHEDPATKLLFMLDGSGLRITNDRKSPGVLCPLLTQSEHDGAWYFTHPMRGDEGEVFIIRLT